MSWNKLNLHCRLTLHLLETEGCVFFVISAVHFLKENSNIQFASAAVYNELNSCGGVDVTKCLLGKPESSKWSFLSRGDTVAKRQEYFNLSHFVLPLVLHDLSRVRCCVTSRTCVCILLAPVTLVKIRDNLQRIEMEKEEN